MTTFRVDHTELARLASKLSLVVSRLNRIEEKIDSGTEGLADDGLEHALRVFASDWKENLSDLRDEAKHVSKLLTNTAATYRTHDAKLAQEFRKAADEVRT